MKIEFIDYEGEEDGGRIYIVIDGEIDMGSEVFSGDFLSASKETFSKLISLSVEKVAEYFSSIRCLYEIPDYEFEIIIVIQIRAIDPFENDFTPHISINPIINTYEWRRPYSVTDLGNFFQKACLNVEGINLKKDFGDYGGDFCIMLDLLDKSRPLKNDVDFLMEKFNEVRKTVELEIGNNFSTDSLTTLFEFPAELKSSCNQYLIYFGQFLADLGINADTTLKEEANKVLFTVTPNGKEHALDVIKEALEVYLNAPNSVVNNSFGNDIAAMQWKTNILRLQSDLELSRAILQAKDASIQALQLTNYQLNNLLHEEKGKHGIEEKILGGTVAIKKYEGKGFSVDFAEILRKLKRKF